MKFEIDLDEMEIAKKFMVFRTKEVREKIIEEIKERMENIVVHNIESEVSVSDNIRVQLPELGEIDTSGC